MMETGESPVQAYPYCKQGRKIKTIVEEMRRDLEEELWVRILISVENSSVLGGKQTVNQILQDMEETLFWIKRVYFIIRKAEADEGDEKNGI